MSLSDNVRNAEIATIAEQTITDLWAQLPPDKQYWIDFRACNGLSFHEDGTTLRMTVGECADLLNITDRTLRRWNNDIPRMPELIALRRRVIFGDKIVGRAWQATAAKAALGEDSHIERILTNFDPHYKSPKQKLEIDVGENLTGIFSTMRKKAEVIDGEFTVSDSGSSGVDGGQRPANLPSGS